MEEVAADLRSPGDFFDLAALLREPFGAFALFELEQLRAQELHRRRLVLGLRSLVLALDDDPAREVGDPHRRVGLVDVLATRSRGAVGVDPQLGVVDLDRDVLVDHRPDVDLGEARVTAGGGVEGRDPDQPVDAPLGGEEAIGVLAAGDEGRRLQPRLLPRGGLLHLDLEAAPLRPAQVHPQQDLGPVLRVGAAGAGVDGDDRVAGVVLAAEQARLFELGEALLDRADLGRELTRQLIVSGRHLGDLLEVVDVALELAEPLQFALGARVGGAGAGGGVLVVPEPGPLHLLLEPLDLSLKRGGVKDNPRAASTARG